MKYVFVLFQENRSFDFYFSTYPGADGLYSQPASTIGGYKQPIVNVDGSGNRLAGYAFGAGRVILVAGVNKIVPDLAAALERIRNTAALAECRKLAKSTPCALTGRCDNEACRGPERQCGKILIIENEKIAGRITVMLIDAPLGF